MKMVKYSRNECMKEIVFGVLMVIFINIRIWHIRKKNIFLHLIK